MDKFIVENLILLERNKLNGMVYSIEASCTLWRLLIDTDKVQSIFSEWQHPFKIGIK